MQHRNALEGQTLNCTPRLEERHRTRKGKKARAGTRGRKRHINIWHINNFSVTPVTDPPDREPDSSRPGTRTKTFMFLGFRTQHINFDPWPPVGRPPPTGRETPPPPPGQSPEKFVYVYVPFPFLRYNSEPATVLPHRRGVRKRKRGGVWWQSSSSSGCSIRLEEKGKQNKQSHTQML